MSILFSKIDKMMGLMNAESQFEIATLISDKYLHGPSKCVVPKSKSKPRKKSEVFHAMREVELVDSSKKGFKKLVGAWCKDEDVGRDPSKVYVVMIKNDQPYGAYAKSLHDGEKYAIVEPKTSTVVQCLHGIPLSSDIGARNIYKWNEFGTLVEAVRQRLLKV
jgi:hypothetical protein